MADKIRPEDLTADERQLLKEQFGWDGQTPVPPNLADVMATTAQTKPLKVDPIRSKSVADAIKNAMLEDIDFDNVQGIKNTGKLNNVLNNAVDAAEQVAAVARDEKPPMLSDTDSTEAKPKVVTEEERLEEERKNREIQKKRQLAALKETVTEDDRQRYAEAVISGTSYTKTFTLFGGKIEITFRDPTNDDMDAVNEQSMIDRNSDRDMGDASYGNVMAFEYQMVASLMSVVADGRNVLDVQPGKSLKAWMPSVRNKIGTQSVDDKVTDKDNFIRWWYYMVTREMLTGSLITLVRDAYTKFVSQMQALPVLAMQPDFFD